MRITGGKFGGRVLMVPKTGDIRPTQDRVRAALFNILAPEMGGVSFLDLFAGSGAVGLEALSRGAATATFVDANRLHIEVIGKNVSALKVSPALATVVIADVYRWIGEYSGNGFDIAFADPPYALGEERGYASVLHMLAERGVVKPNGIFVAEMSAVQKAEETSEWDLLRDRKYGKTRLCIWRRIK